MNVEVGKRKKKVHAKSQRGNKFLYSIQNNNNGFV